MKTHSNFASRIFGILAIVGVGWLQPTAAYGQTAEGTVIDNIATVSFTDANSNVYSTVQDNVTVTVGFSAGVDVSASQATATPATPSTLNTIDFDVSNIGNGTDNVSVAEGITDGTVITAITNYRFNSTDYGSIALLNTALAAFPFVAGATETITVEYTIASDKGGQPSTYTLTATSVRDSGESDNDNTVVTPGLSGSVATTPNGGQSLTHLPSGGASPTYTFTFNVANDQNGVDDFNLVASTPGSVVITIVSVDGVGGSSATISALGAGLNQDVDVIYTVANVAAGSLDSLYLDATAVAGSATNQGFIDMTLIKANLTITKQAWDDGRGAQVSADVLPGMFIEYRISVSNTGSAAATNVHIDDILPAEVTYVSATPDAAGWTFSNTLNDFDADLTGGPLAAAATRFFWIRVSIN
jgi:uncharacterized repeat protein (TIGR01451 family)